MKFSIWYASIGNGIAGKISEKEEKNHTSAPSFCLCNSVVPRRIQEKKKEAGGKEGGGGKKFMGVVYITYTFPVGLIGKPKENKGRKKRGSPLNGGEPEGEEKKENRRRLQNTSLSRSWGSLKKEEGKKGGGNPRVRL